MKLGHFLRMLALAAALGAMSACANNRAVEVSAEVRREPQRADETTLAPRPARLDLDDWVGSYKRSFACFTSKVEVLNWRGEYVARIWTGGARQVRDDLLCRVRPDGPDRLDVLFEKRGPTAGYFMSYQPEETVVTLVRTQDRVRIEARALLPKCKRKPPPPVAIAELPALEGLRLDEFMRILEVERRLQALLGEDSKWLKEQALGPFTSSTPASRARDRIFLIGRRIDDFRAGIVYDVSQDVIITFSFDPRCRERIDVWAENWNYVGDNVLQWIRSHAEPGTPLRKHHR